MVGSKQCSDVLFEQDGTGCPGGNQRRRPVTENAWHQGHRNDDHICWCYHSQAVRKTWRIVKPCNDVTKDETFTVYRHHPEAMCHIFQDHDGMTVHRCITPHSAFGHVAPELLLFFDHMQIDCALLCFLIVLANHPTKMWVSSDLHNQKPCKAIRQKHKPNICPFKIS